jgi:hypothetical protein
MSLKYNSVYIDNKEYTVKKYNEIKKKNPKSIIFNYDIFNKNGKQLEYVESKQGKFRSHFRIRHNQKGTTNPMTDWHCLWGNYFLEIKEKIYNHENMIKSNRRADVDLNEKKVIELQHSCISKEEVDNRKHDWNLVNKEILWVIDGSDTIEVTELKNSGRIFLEFKSKPWKYESFLSYDTIYIDIKNKLYKVNPNFVKSNMIDVQLPVLRENFIDSLKKDKQLFTDEKINQTNIYVKQQGAGNGKTYGIVQLIQDEKFKHYDTFVYLTKQHSAVHVISSEIKDQMKRGDLNNVEIINENKVSNKYIINFKNKSNNNQRKIIIGTFDSFVYALGNQQIKACDKFVAMAKSIIDEELRCTRNGKVQYAGGIKLNKRLLLIGDEMQDLSEEYIKAVIKITRDRYVDFYGVGDLLQSISIKKNSFAFLYKNDLPNDTIKVTKYQPSNICRRFNNKKLVNFVNSIVPFSKEEYSLPTVKSFNETLNDDSLVIFNGKSVYSHDDNNKVQEEIDNIMKFYINEVEKNNYKPNDFLIVTPFSSKNTLVDALNTSIRNFWKNKYNDKEYIKHSIFHKSDTGTSIDLTESDEATRIVSIHSSKGDGRPVVFVIGLSEDGLKKFSNESNNLIYDSLIHVALTRMKKKLYVRLECNNDNIHQRIQKYITESGDIQKISPYIKISKSIKLESLFQNTQKQIKNFNICTDKIFKFTKYLDLSLDDEENKELIDMKHHCVRFITFYILLVLEIMKCKSEDISENISLQQIYQIWRKILEKDVTYISSSRTYYKKLYDEGYNKTNLPILKYSSEEGDYSKYSEYLEKEINSIRKKLSKFLRKGNNMKFKVLESIIMYHLMQLSDQGKFADLPISDLYDIIDLYKKAKPDEKDLYLQSHYNKINLISELINKLNSDYVNLRWILDHFVYFDGKSSDFEVFKKFNILAYNNDVVLICYIKPQFNQLNYNEVMLDSIFDTFLIKNVQKKDGDSISENFKKFNGKKILTCVFSFDCDEPFIFDWSDMKNNNDLININNDSIKEIIKDDLYSNFEIKNNNIYLFYKYYLEEFKNEEPLTIITKIIDKYNKKKDEDKRTKFPKYIDELFFEIKSSIKKKNKEKQLEILKNYTDRKTFMEEITYNLNEAVNNFFK